MGKRAECIQKTWRTKEGVRVSGHEFIAKLAIYDEGIDRTYTVGECEHCGTMDAGWCSGESSAAQRYDQMIRLGGYAKN